ncbi:M50 family metallopeptidase [Peribacillus kribbensis]|uniref:M50 family metallopeptidase n=1 Tax=Peribacillus kribbensis TaxID=356658 RepID=UPI0004017B67|nr:M50 family metallopeptidase [Peribacillus kribbensis]
MILAIYIIAAFILCRIPWIGRYLSILNTLIHECGHALCSLLFDGKVRSISLFSNGEGHILTGSRSWFGMVITSIAGYPFSSIFALFCFLLIHWNHSEWIFYLIAGISILALVLWVRNLYGIVWCLSFIVLLGVIDYYGNGAWITGSSLLLASLLLIQSAESAFAIFLLSFKTPGEAGDASNLAQFTRIPAQIWGLVFLGIAIFALTKALLISY